MNPNPNNQKRKWDERSASSESVNQNVKKLALVPPKSRRTGSVKPCEEYGHTNQATLECQVGTNKCLWCGSVEYFIAAYPERLRTTNVRIAQHTPSLHLGPLSPFCKGPPPPFR